MKSAAVLSATIAVFAILLSACTAEQTAPPVPADRLTASLIQAIRANHVADVRSLLTRGANPDSIEAAPAGTLDGRLTALIVAVKSGNIELVRALINAGADVNLRKGGEHDGATPLIVAASQGHESIVKLLLRSGANVNARMGLDGTLPGALHWAVTHDHRGVVNILLSEGAIVDRRDLYESIHSGRASVVAQLLEGGGDPHWRFSTGRTVMEEAERSPEATRGDVISAVRIALGPIPRPDQQAR